MRIALDSSVLVAAHISRAGVCAELLEDVLLHHDLVSSEFILGELRRKLLDKFHFPAREVGQVSAFLRRVSFMVVPADLPASVCRDAEDIAVLGTAVAGDCGLLISVDRDLLDLESFRGIPIVRPGAFWHRGMSD